MIAIPNMESTAAEWLHFAIRVFVGYTFVAYVWKKIVGSGGTQAMASHILVKTEAECLALKKDIDGGAQFFDVAAKHSTCPSGKSGGALGKFGRGQMVPAFDKVVFNPECALNVVHGPVATQFGYHLILITSRDEPEKKGN